MKKSIKKIIALALACVFVFACFVGCSKESGNDDSKEYIIATDTTFAPFEFTDENGNFTGIDVDILAAVAEDQGFKYKLNSIGFDAAVAALESNQADGVIAGMSITEARMEKYDFSDAYFQSYQCMAVKEDSTIASFADAQGQTVAAKKGTEGASMAETLAEKYDLKITYFDDSPTMYEAVKTGTAVACFEDAPVIAYGCSQGNGLKVVTNLEDAQAEGFQGSPYGFAVMKGQNTELHDMFQQGLENIIANGKMAEICAKYGIAYEG